MKRPHRWAALLTALLMAMTLAITPREGVAGGGPYRPIDTSDPPVNLFGEPDIGDAPRAEVAPFVRILAITVSMRQDPLGLLCRHLVLEGLQSAQAKACAPVSRATR